MLYSSELFMKQNISGIYEQILWFDCTTINLYTFEPEPVLLPKVKKKKEKAQQESDQNKKSCKKRYRKLFFVVTQRYCRFYLKK